MPSEYQRQWTHIVKQRHVDAYQAHSKNGARPALMPILECAFVFSSLLSRNQKKDAAPSFSACFTRPSFHKEHTKGLQTSPVLVQMRRIQKVSLLFCLCTESFIVGHVLGSSIYETMLMWPEDWSLWNLSGLQNAIHITVVLLLPASQNQLFVHIQTVLMVMQV